MSGEKYVNDHNTYQTSYGRITRVKPDLSRCCVEVTDYSLNWPQHHQCQRKRGYGPDEAYCKQHDPEIVKAREIESTKRHNDKWNKVRYEIHGKTFFEALQKIADGCNDARSLAQEIITKFKEGEHT